MKRHLLILGLIFFTLPSFLLAQDIVGTWNGKLALPNGLSLRIVFHITKSEQGYAATLDSPDQGAKGIPVKSVSFVKSVLELSMPDLNASYKGSLKEPEKISGTFTQGALMPLDLTKGEAKKQERPQEPHPPFPYKVEDVTFKNAAAGITLAGTLTMPRQGSAFPAVVLITGSGPQNRNEEMLGHKPFLLIADYLTRNGVAVLRFDDRGAGKSGGKFQTALTTDFASDAASAFRYLKTRKEINSSKIGLLGHSEGAEAAFMIAASNKEVAFVVSLAGAGVKGGVLMLKQAEMLAKSMGITDSKWQSAMPMLKERYALLIQDKSAVEIRKELRANVEKELVKTSPDAIKGENARKMVDSQVDQMCSPWFINLIKYDPAADLKKIKCPLLALNGLSDIQVDATMNLAGIESNVLAGGNKRVTIKKYPGLNHLFQHCKAGTVAEYGELEETLSPEVLRDIKDWILLNVK